MRRVLLGVAGIVVAVLATWSGPQVLADGAVVVAFPKGATEIATMRVGVPLLAGRTQKLIEVPGEVSGMKFTRRPPKGAGSAEVDVPAGSVFYLGLGDGKSAKSSRDSAERDGFVEVGPGHLDDGGGFLVYKKSYSQPTHLTLKAGGPLGVIVIAKELEVKGNSGEDTPVAPSSSTPKEPTLAPDPPTKLHALDGPTTKPALMQTSIHCMTVIEQRSGMRLGLTEDAILTVLHGSSPTEVNFRFISSVGPQMRGARDDAVRFVHVRYPNWTAGGAELTTSERDMAMEGPSMGAALATLLRSAIEGFAIDRHTAVTGDISADGQILPIGGVYAKLRGAEAADCKLAVIPADNLSALINTEDFIGKGQVPAVQVLGAETIEDVIADVRADRGEKLSEAISLFDEVQAKIADSKTYVHSPECAEKLTQVLRLEPKHLSAKLLLMEATHKRPKTLSVAATKYYVTAAVSGMLPILAERATSKEKLPPSSVVRQGLDELEKLRPMAAPETLPWVDAWERLIRTTVSFQSGLATSDNLMSQAQAVDDAEAKLDMNPELMQKMLKEGI